MVSEVKLPYNGSGSFGRLYSFVQDKANGIFIDSTRMDNEITGVATGLSNVICRDGQTTLTADIPWNGKKITGYGTTNAPSARSDVPQIGQVQDAKFNWVVAGGTADAITATYAPVITALVDGQECRFRATAANATTTPTFSPNGLTAHTITKLGGAALVAGDIPAALAEITLRYNLANTRWEFVNASIPTGTSGHVVGFLDGNNTSSGNNTASGTLAQNGTLTMGAAINETFVTVAVAGTTNIGAAAGNLVDLSGTGIITNFGTVQAGTRRQVRITHVSGVTLQSGGSMILPAGVDLALNQFDQFQAESYGGGTWAVVNVTRSGGGVVVPASAAVTLAGTDASLALTAAGFAGNKSLAASGYYKLPGGLIIQWGSISVTGGGPTTGSFPIAFASSCYQIIGSQSVTGNITGAQVVLVPISTSQYNASCATANTSTISWMAVGV
jgi:hypothetical protein